MLSEKEIVAQIFSIKTEEDFNRTAISVFNYQYEFNSVYKKYVDLLTIKPTNITHYLQIPFLPIEFFKTQQVICNSSKTTDIIFSSSGTTKQINSKHLVTNVDLYKTSYSKGFEQFYGNITDYCILALLPNYLEREGSSLVYMFDDLIKKSQQPLSNFYLYNVEDLIHTIRQLKQQKQKTILLGVTYALLDLAEKNISLNENFIVMETGGMKGKRKELLKEEIHQLLKQSFNIKTIHSEYGMTELLSQAYSKENGLFNCPPWMRVLIRDINDPFNYLAEQKNGGINVIDLANLNSCSFIETKDLGKKHNHYTFEIIGRFDNSDLRGCNLMIQ